jgi:hypothetical protein
MADTSNWNWEPGEREVVDYGSWKEDHDWVWEPYASPDGETLAAVVQNEEGEFTMLVNGEPWESAFERIWSIKYSPDNRMVAFASEMGEWKLMVDGEPSEETYGFLWDLQFSEDGSAYASAVQNDMQYCMQVNGQPWEELYDNANHFLLSPSGKHSAAVVQAEAMETANIFKFQQGVFSVAVDGKAWDARFENAWHLAFNDDESMVAAAMRTSPFDYSVAVDGKPWDQVFQCVWEPVFKPGTSEVYAPVRAGGKWTMAKDGQLFWNGKYIQCWRPQFNSEGSRLAAIVSPKWGRWTIAVDDKPWKTTYGDLVDNLTFSPDGGRIGAVGKENERWFIFVDDNPWSGDYDMAWAPVFSPDGSHVAAKVEKGGVYTLLINGRELGEGYQFMENPSFSPDSSKMLIRGVKNGKYVRTVKPVAEIG